MPITLEKLFSGTRTISFTFMGEDVRVTYAPLRYTGEMQELAQKAMSESGDARDEIALLREQAEAVATEAIALEEAGEAAGEGPGAGADKRLEASQLYEKIASQEIQLDTREKALIRSSLAALVTTWDVLGADGKPIPTDIGTLKTLPDVFLRLVYLHLADENSADPPKAPTSETDSSTEKGSAPSLSGTNSSPQPARSASRRSSSTKERTAPAITPSGAPGR